MLFKKYQYNQDYLNRRGYSQTCIVYDEFGEQFFAKWILGIEKNSTKSKILSEKLRHFQKANDPMLPKIIEYGYDEECKTFAIVYEYIESRVLEDWRSKTENNYWALNDNYSSSTDENAVLLGLSDVAECLCALHFKHKITHGDLSPANILVDHEGKFHLIDFGLADITQTLSQEKDLQIFARGFAAPEKYSKAKKGFQYQSDIYSFGKILEWVCDKFTQHNLSDEEQRYLDEKLLADDPKERPTWKDVVAFMKKLGVSEDTKYIITDLHKLESEYIPDFLLDLNSTKPKFDISPKEGNNIRMDIYTDKYRFNALWVVNDKKLVLLKVEPKEDEPKRNSVNDFDFDACFLNTEEYCSQYEDDEVSLCFQRWYQKKRQETKYFKRNREATKKELDFYDEVLDKEIEVIKNHSLKIQYSNFVVKGNEIHFTIVENDKCTSNAGINQHIDNGSDVNADPIRYVVSANGEIAKEPLSFIGTPMDLAKVESDKGEKCFCFKIKDCQYFDKNKTPIKGFLMEDYSVKIEEKRRQKDAIIKVRKNEVQNPDLIYYLFRPKELEGDFVDYEDYNIEIKQKGINKYSDNQKKAIVNALQRTPLSIIQGPPGTGKTTVITEIVFQLLEQNPDSKILITSQTNNAVDQVLENLMKNDIPILRLSGLTEPRVEAIKKHTIKRKLGGWKDVVVKNAKDNLSKFKNRPDYNELEELHKDWLSTISSIKEEGSINQRLVDSIRVIGATCNHIASKKYCKFNFEFDYIIMDESGKATVAESLVPIVLGNNLVFVGDHRQLRPMLTANKEVEKWLRDKHKKEDVDEYDGFDEYFDRPSLFEEVIETIDEDFKTQLTKCRRSAKLQVELTSKCFYEPEGDEKIEYVKRPKVKEHNLPLSIDSSIFMIDIGSEYENEKDGQSSYNRESVKAIANILERLDKYDIIRGYSVGLITAYSAQHRKLRSQIRRMKLDNIRNWNVQKDEEKFTVSVIDRFQGLERDVVIVDLVKSGASLNLGFLETPNRINVGLSRQKRLLIIVGDYRGIINAKTKRKRWNGQKCALQKYLMKIPKNCIINAKELNNLFK